MLVRGPFWQWETEQKASAAFPSAQMIGTLRNAESCLGQGESLPNVCRALAVFERILYR
jgi:hypothetical protein